MLTLVCWKWRSAGYRTEYRSRHVNVLRRMLERHLTRPHRLVCVTDDPEGVECETFPLWGDCSTMLNPSGPHFPSCYRRLKIFDPATTEAMGLVTGDPVVSLDLDVVLVDRVDALFDHDETFFGWRRVGLHHPVAYNGTIFMFRAGMMPWLWTNFKPVTSPAEARRAKFFGSDQGWISYCLNGAAPGWTQSDGVLSFSSDPVRGPRLPPGARMVSFNGKKKPWDPQVQAHTAWIKEHYR